MAGYYELKKTAGGKFHFTLKAGNHEVILSSQQYVAKADAQNGIASVRSNAAADRFERKTSTKGEAYFTLNATNGQIVGQSEMYSSTAAMEKGIASVKANAPSETVKDLSAEG